MKLCYLFFFIFVSYAMAQTKINVFDENVSSKNTIILYERIDGSIFEKRGISNWTEHKVFPTSRFFANFVKAKNPITFEYERLNGDKYTIINGGTWLKSQKRFEPQGEMNLQADYINQNNIIEVRFKTAINTLIEIDLHSVYGAEIIPLHKGHQQIGHHRLSLSTDNVPAGEYVLVVRTLQKVETLRLSITK